MKRNFTLLSFILVLCSSKFIAQTFNGIGLTGFNTDVIAESNPAATSTGAAIDANYVLFSSTYTGTLTNTGGLLASRVYTNSTRTYSLAPYNQKNTVSVAFNTKDSLSLTTPGNYSVISLLGFSTVVDATADITLKFTDGTSVLYTSKTFYNWASIQPGFTPALGKTNRITDAVYYTPTEPKMFAVDLPIACANQSKLLSKIIVKNNTNSSLIYLFSASAVDRSTYTSSSIPVACLGGNNGSAKVFGIDSYGPLTYSWNSSPVQTTQTATNLMAGNYTVTIMDGNGCAFTSSVAVSQPTTAFSLVSITSNSLSCATVSNGNAAVTVTGGTTPYTYSWTNTSVTTSTIGSLTAGNYTVIATDALGCAITATTSIAAPNVIISVNTSSLLCGTTPNATATVGSVTGATGPYTYTWTTSPVQTTTVATGIAAGSYSVLVKDASGCVNSKVFSILAPDFNLSITPTTCTLSTGSATVSAITGGSGGPYTYTWTSSPVQNTSIASNLPSGNYTVTVKDVAGCAIIKSFSLAASNPTLMVTTTSASCGNLANGSASVSITGGTGGPYTYTWTTSPVQTNSVATNISAGAYSVTVKGTGGCVSTQSFSIAQPTLLISTTPSACQNIASGSASVSVIGGTGPYLYYWNGSTVAGPNTIGNLGINTFSIGVVDANSCLITGSYDITGPAGGLSATISTTVATCAGINDGKARVVATGGTAPYAYSWNTNPPQTTALATGLPSANTFTCTIIDYNNCFIKKGATILPFPLNINLIVSPSNSICPNTTVSIAASGASSYTWSTGAHTSSITVTPPGTTNTITSTAYSFTGTSTSSCIVTGSTSIVTTTLVGNCVLGVEEQSAISYNLYPNPNNGKFVLKLDNTYDNSILEIVDALGKIVVVQTIVNEETTVNTSSLQNGIYFVTVRNNDRILVRTKIIKQ